MGNSVTARPIHYETLGITPAASDDEIRQAFARKTSECRWDLMGASAQVCIAYETLGNRFKRVDYDRSHGLEPKPQPRLSTITFAQRRWAPFVASVPMNALGQSARDDTARSQGTSPRDLESDLESLAAQNPGVLVAQSLDEQPYRIRPGKSEERQPDWKRPVLAIGGFVLAAGLIGGFAGLSLKDDEGSTPIEPSAAISAPRQTPQPKAAVRLANPLATDAGVNEPTIRFVASEPRPRPVFSRRRAPWHARHRAVKSRTNGKEPVDGQLIPSQAVTEAPPAQPVAADVLHSTR